MVINSIAFAYLIIFNAFLNDGVCWLLLFINDVLDVIMTRLQILSFFL
jgi:hypothetical protein